MTTVLVCAVLAWLVLAVGIATVAWTIGTDVGKQQEQIDVLRVQIVELLEYIGRDGNR